MAKKLGKGLSEIFGENIDSFLEDISNGDSSIKVSGTQKVDISKIRPNPYQPRKQFDQNALNELAESIRINGVFEPIIIRESLSGYELVAGERRLRASKIAGLKQIPAVIVEFDETQMMEISLLENIQREDLSAIEQANAYQQLINKLGYTQDELAKRIGKSRTNVTNLLRLLKLPASVQEMIANNALSYGQARTLLALEDEKRIEELANKCVKEGLSVRVLEQLVKKKETKPKAEKTVDPYMEDVRISLERRFSTSVDLSNKAITIRYNSVDDLNRILEIMGAIEGND